MSDQVVSENKLARLFTYLLTTNMRIAEAIIQLKSLIPVAKQTQKSKINRKYLSTIFSQERDSIRIFKLSVLVNQSILEGYVPDADILISLLVTNNSKSQNSIPTNSNFSFLSEKIVTPYLFYLQKRINFENERQMKVGTDIKSTKSMGYKMIKSRFSQAKMWGSGHREEAQQVYTEVEKCYNIINLLRKILYFWPDAIKMFRYIGGYYGFMVDFNIVVGHDARALYHQMKSIFFSIVQCIQEQASDQIISQVQKLTNEIQKINEGCQQIYYNSYNCNELKKLAPKLIDSELYFHMAENIKKLRKRKTIFCSKKHSKYIYDASSIFLSFKQSQSTFFQTGTSQVGANLGVRQNHEIIMDPLEASAQEDLKDMGHSSWVHHEENLQNRRKIENCKLLEEMKRLLSSMQDTIDLRQTTDSFSNS